MSESNDDVAELRAVVDRRRDELGLTLQRLSHVAGYNSTQALQAKLAGRVRFQPPEIAALAKQLDMDGVELAQTLWPELLETDRLAGIRARLVDASDEDLAEVESWLDTRKEPKSAPRARRRPHTA